MSRIDEAKRERLEVRNQLDQLMEVDAATGAYSDIKVPEGETREGVLAKVQDYNAKLAKLTNEVETLERADAFRQNVVKNVLDKPEDNEPLVKMAERNATSIGREADMLEFQAGVLAHWLQTGENALPVALRNIGHRLHMEVNSVGDVLQPGKGPQNLNPQRSEVMNAIEGSVSTQAGWAISPIIEAEIVARLSVVGAMRSVANVRSAGSGNRVVFGTQDSSTVYGRLIAEGALPPAATDPAYGTINMDFDEIIALPVDISSIAVSDSAVDFVADIMRILLESTQRAEDSIWTQGSSAGTANAKHHSSTQNSIAILDSANGFAGARQGAASQSPSLATNLNYEELVRFIGTLPAPYRMGSGTGTADGDRLGNAPANATLMMNEATATALQLLTDSAGLPIFRTEVAAGSLVSRFAGFRYVINGEMPAIAAGATSMVLAAFARGFQVRDAVGREIIRLEGDTRRLQRLTGFAMYSRTAGAVVDRHAGTIYTQAAS